MPGLIGLESLHQDLRYAIRWMLKSPGFSTIAILTLAVGIGANTAIFSAMDAALFRSLPFANADRLVRLRSVRKGAPLGGPSPLDVRDLSRAAHSFEGMVAYDRWRKNVSGIRGANAPEEMVVGLVPGSYFALLGIQPILGRLFTETENQIGKNFVAAISANFWSTRFASDPRILGRTLRINDETYVIIAVMPDVIPAWLDQTSVPISIWTPFASADAFSEAARADRGDFALGRLKPGVSYEQARAELATLSAQLSSEHPIDEGGHEYDRAAR